MDGLSIFCAEELIYQSHTLKIMDAWPAVFRMVPAAAISLSGDRVMHTVFGIADYIFQHAAEKFDLLRSFVHRFSHDVLVLSIMEMKCEIAHVVPPFNTANNIL